MFIILLILMKINKFFLKTFQTNCKILLFQEHQWNIPKLLQISEEKKSESINLFCTEKYILIFLVQIPDFDSAIYLCISWALILCKWNGDWRLSWPNVNPKWLSLISLLTGWKMPTKPSHYNVSRVLSGL